jgi:hypothetical protein
MSTSIPFNREFLRSGIFSRLSWSETATYLQIRWNAPLPATKVLGLSRSRIYGALNRLGRLGLVKKLDTGYIPIHDWSKEENFVWVEPLRYGWLTPRARILLIFLDEWTRGRRYCFHRGMAEAIHQMLGISAAWYHRILVELRKHGLVRKRRGTFTTLTSEERAHFRLHPGYIRTKQDVDEAPVAVPPNDRDGIPVPPSGLHQSHRVPQTCPTECTTTVPPGTSKGSLSGVSPGLSLRIVEGEASERAPSAPAEADTLGVHPGDQPMSRSRLETWIQVFLDSKAESIPRKYHNHLRAEFSKEQYARQLAALSPSAWLVCVGLTCENDTRSFKHFIKNDEFKDILDLSQSYIDTRRCNGELCLFEQLDLWLSCHRAYFSDNEHQQIRDELNWWKGRANPLAIGAVWLPYVANGTWSLDRLRTEARRSRYVEEVIAAPGFQSPRFLAATSMSLEQVTTFMRSPDV